MNLFNPDLPNFLPIWVLIGLAAAALYIVFARAGHVGRERRAYVNGLIIAAFIYVVFAVTSGEWTWLAVEAAGSAVFGLLAIYGKRSNFYLVALAWALHPIWDAVLHLNGPAAHVAPAWYGISCLSFDLLLACYIVFRILCWRQTHAHLT